VIVHDNHHFILFSQGGWYFENLINNKKKTRVPYRTKGKEETKEGKGKEEREKNKKQHKRENALYVTRSFCLPA
jgi:hypothetical protein